VARKQHARLSRRLRERVVTSGCHSCRFQCTNIAQTDGNRKTSTRSDLIFAKTRPSSEVKVAASLIHASPFPPEARQSRRHRQQCERFPENVEVLGFSAPHALIVQSPARLRIVFVTARPENIARRFPPISDFPLGQLCYQLAAPRRCSPATRFAITSWYDNSGGESGQKARNPTARRAIGRTNLTIEMQHLGYVEVNVVTGTPTPDARSLLP